MQEGSDRDVYRDASASVERRVDDLLARMTLDEKAAQLGSVNADRVLADGEVDHEIARELLTDGIGHLTRVGGEGGLDPTDAARATNELQAVLSETRLGVPAIPHEECLSGYMGPEGTTFPQAIGMGSTWNPSLIEAVTRTIRDQLQAIGCAHALSPVLDIARDLRWGRVEETFGEDPTLAAAMACAYVSGLQGDGPEEGISATLKHFVGHGAGKGGKNRSSVDLAPRQLREVHMFPFEAAVRVAGAESVMNAYHDIDGTPCAKAEWLLTDVLRGEWSFDGTVVSDYYSVEFLRSEHGVAATGREAGIAALQGGIDVELPYTDCYEHLADAVRDEELAEETLDEAVRRVLRAKVRKGLFEDATVDADAAAAAFHTEEATALARRAALESMVILKNDRDLLPLEGVGSIAVVGPQADSPTGMLGDYAYAAHYTGKGYEFDATTPLEAIERRTDAEVTYTEGCTLTGPSTDGFDEAAETAAGADVTLAFVGTRSTVDLSDPDEAMKRRPEVSTSGEGRDVTDLSLPGLQQELVERVHETGTPLVVVLISGKAHSIEWIADEVPAVLEAWYPGEEGGNAIVDVLFEGEDPGGRLPVSFPRSVGQLPVHYSRKPNTANENHVYTEASPVYPFGHGLSYADYEYEDFELSPDVVSPTGAVSAAITVTNTSDRDGHEVVQLYTHSVNPSQARPVQELKGFQRLHLEAGESKRVSFELSATQLAFYDREVNLAVESGPYEVRMGRSSADIVATGTFEVTESMRVPRTGRTYFSEVDVEESG